MNWTQVTDQGLPPIDAALECQLDAHRSVLAVVHSHLGNSSVRAVVTDSTRGMREAPGEVRWSALDETARSRNSSSRHLLSVFDRDTE